MRTEAMATGPLMSLESGLLRELLATSCTNIAVVFSSVVVGGSYCSKHQIALTAETVTFGALMGLKPPLGRKLSVARVAIVVVDRSIVIFESMLVGKEFGAVRAEAMTGCSLMIV